MSAPGIDIVNGWHLLAHGRFIDQIKPLRDQVKKLNSKDPNHYKNTVAAKRLNAISTLIYKKIPADPTLSEYRQGNTLGAEYKHWLRAKFFQQYRIFFRYHLECKIIIYCWVNDESTLRARGKKSDAYQVFKKMLKKGSPPNNWNDLLKESRLIKN